MVYQVQIAAAATKQLQKLDGGIQRRIGSAIDGLAKTPRPAGVKKLAGGEDLFRIRVGDYRVVYEIHDRLLVVLVVKLGHRSDVYR